MAITITQFRQQFPAFEDSNKFPDSSVSMWLNVAPKVHNAERWGDMLETGIMLYVAHHVVGDSVAAMEVAAGGLPGMRGGVIASESGDSVSVSFDTTSVLQEGAGHWNSTIYGRRWYALARLFGAGPVQVGPGSGGDPVFSAWSGPPHVVW